MALSLFACFCYVYESYEPMNQKSWWQTLELTVGVIFGMDYILRFYLAKEPFSRYCYSFL